MHELTFQKLSSPLQASVARRNANGSFHVIATPNTHTHGRKSQEMRFFNASFRHCANPVKQNLRQSDLGPSLYDGMRHDVRLAQTLRLSITQLRFATKSLGKVGRWGWFEILTR